jgi:hypothetical protein
MGTVPVGRDAGDRHVPARVQDRQLCKLDVEQVEIPTCTKGDLFLGDPERPDLRFSEPDQLDGRDLSQADLPRNLERRLRDARSSKRFRNEPCSWPKVRY